MDTLSAVHPSTEIYFGSGVGTPPEVFSHGGEVSCRRSTGSFSAFASSSRIERNYDICPRLPPVLIEQSPRSTIQRQTATKVIDVEKRLHFPLVCRGMPP